MGATPGHLRIERIRIFDRGCKTDTAAIRCDPKRAGIDLIRLPTEWHIGYEFAQMNLLLAERIAFFHGDRL